MGSLHDDLIMNIRDLAAARGWSMNRTADAAGISRSGLSNITRNAKSPTLATVEKLAAAFEVPVDRLLRRTPSPRPALPLAQTLARK
jgi:transcriptional regulator with XRE-family HTH domain